MTLVRRGSRRSGVDLTQVVGNARAEDRESPLDARARSHGSLSRATQIGIVEVHEAVHSRANFAPLTQLLPFRRSAKGAHRLQEGAYGLTVADDDAVNAPYLARLGGHAEAMCGADEGHRGFG